MRRALFLLVAVGLTLGLGPACGGGDDGGGGGGDGAIGAGDEVPEGILVEADEYEFDPAEITAPAGQVTFVLKNVGSLEHDLTIDEADFKLRALAGQTETGSVDLEAGTYEVYCSVAGHRAAGMEGTLTVE